MPVQDDQIIYNADYSVGSTSLGTDDFQQLSKLLDILVVSVTDIDAKRDELGRVILSNDNSFFHSGATIIEEIKNVPQVGIIGAQQVGKSYLLNKLMSNKDLNYIKLGIREHDGDDTNYKFLCNAIEALSDYAVRIDMPFDKIVANLRRYLLTYVDDAYNNFVSLRNLIPISLPDIQRLWDSISFSNVAMIGSQHFDTKDEQLVDDYASVIQEHFMNYLKNAEQAYEAEEDTTLLTNFDVDNVLDNYVEARNGLPVDKEENNLVHDELIASLTEQQKTALTAYHKKFRLDKKQIMEQKRVVTLHWQSSDLLTAVEEQHKSLVDSVTSYFRTSSAKLMAKDVVDQNIVVTTTVSDAHIHNMSIGNYLKLVAFDIFQCIFASTYPIKKTSNLKDAIGMFGSVFKNTDLSRESIANELLNNERSLYSAMMSLLNKIPAFNMNVTDAMYDHLDDYVVLEDGLTSIVVNNKMPLLNKLTSLFVQKGYITLLYNAELLRYFLQEGVNHKLWTLESISTLLTNNKNKNNFDLKAFSFHTCSQRKLANMLSRLVNSVDIKLASMLSFRYIFHMLWYSEPLAIDARIAIEILDILAASYISSSLSAMLTVKISQQFMVEGLVLSNIHAISNDSIELATKTHAHANKYDSLTLSPDQLVIFTRHVKRSDLVNRLSNILLADLWMQHPRFQDVTFNLAKVVKQHINVVGSESVDHLRIAKFFKKDNVTSLAFNGININDSAKTLIKDTSKRLNYKIPPSEDPNIKAMSDVTGLSYLDDLCYLIILIARGELKVADSILNKMCVVIDSLKFLLHTNPRNLQPYPSILYIAHLQSNDTYSSYTEYLEQYWLSLSKELDNGYKTGGINPDVYDFIEHFTKLCAQINIKCIYSINFEGDVRRKFDEVTATLMGRSRHLVNLFRVRFISGFNTADIMLACSGVKLPLLPSSVINVLKDGIITILSSGLDSDNSYVKDVVNLATESVKTSNHISSNELTSKVLYALFQYAQKINK